MDTYLRQILTSQYEASLAMINQCVAACAEQHWEGKIANDSFRQIAYHTLFFTDLYLSPREEKFVRRELHSRGGDETGPELSPGLGKEETLAYVTASAGRKLANRWRPRRSNRFRGRRDSPGENVRAASCTSTTFAIFNTTPDK